MGQSYRIRTEQGVNKTINVQLDQEYDFLEILSLAIQQADIYPQSCADYGVIVGRVTANNGLGLPNARISVFIPISSIDESNPIISSIYPYKSPADKNEDGYRYNLLPYEKSYSKHAATGTLPTRNDALTGSTAVEIFDKYYKFSSKTNESGDYMIMGVPQGAQQLVMDVDLSDIGEFSLTPQDLIRMGRATEAQVSGNKFRTSTDLNSLPQIVSLTKYVDVSPLWGDPELCQLAINRVDFDLRNDANIDIQPTSTFMGSLYSSPDNMRIRPGFKYAGIFSVAGCKPRDNMGNMCSLQSGPGQILAIRQTIGQDAQGNPVLEQYELEQAGNIIDGNGVWLTELPMNLDYIYTNEFGEKVLSNDPNVGVPTKAKYRFKVKWQQPPTLTESVRRGYFLVPNVREYGWTSTTSDPNYQATGTTANKQLSSSYYFGLDWSGYTNGFSGQFKLDKLNTAIDCEDTFYEFQFNRVYTVAGLIDEYKKGNKGRFIGIKEIDSDDCSASVNKFPVNDGFRNFDFLFFLFSLIFTILQPVGMIVLIIAHVIYFIRNLFYDFLCWLSGIGFSIIAITWYPFRRWKKYCSKENPKFKLPMITYPECQACECSQNVTTTPSRQENSGGNGILTYLSSPNYYQAGFEVILSGEPQENIVTIATNLSEATAGFAGKAFISNSAIYKNTVSNITDLPSDLLVKCFASSKTLPLGERINLFNQRSSYFSGVNKIKVTFAKDSNVNNFHFDNTITLLSNQQFAAGDLLTTVNPTGTTDVNWSYSANTPTGPVTGISGTTYNGSGSTSINLTYATGQYSDTSVTYSLPYGSTETNYKFPSDVEYFQVVTAITISDAVKIWNTSSPQKFPNVIDTPMITDWWKLLLGIGGKIFKTDSIKVADVFEGFNEQYVLILQRGVDPYSPLYTNEYNLGNIFGSNENDPKFVVTATTRINIPIQKLTNPSISVQPFNSQTDIYYQSYFFSPGIASSTTPGYQYSGFNTTLVGYYGSLDASNYNPSYMATYSNTVVSLSSSGYYDNAQNSATYDISEDVSGMGIMKIGDYPNVVARAPYNNFGQYYYTKVLLPQIQSNPFLINNASLNVMRTDRLPSSDLLDGGSWDNNPSILQQNINFGMYLIDTSGGDITSVAFTTGAEQVTPDIEGLANSVSVLESFNCEKMVGLDCYTGFGSQFQINQDCTTKDAVENGCYVFVRQPLTDLKKDLGNFAEWGFRFRFFYGLCRGVLAQSFVNNWVNGSLYAFPIQVDTYYDKQNKPYSNYCLDIIYYDQKTTNFYYRSSPYSDTQNRFIGKSATQTKAVNKTNLLFPTTIINLGMKDYFYREITFDASTNAYIMTELDSTSYGDTSDLVNLFAISRMTDESFLAQILQFGDNSLNQLFSRPEKRIDGDLAQMMSINSEIGVIKFSPEYYDIPPNAPAPVGDTYFVPTTILGNAGDPAIAVWFSSTTQNLQTKDYLTPGRIDFRLNDNANYIPYPYGIKSQQVPFYQWQQVTNPQKPSIFGTQNNSWATGTGDIVTQYYQSLDRTIRTQPTYFQSDSAPSNNDTYQRGYIFSVNGTGQYSSVSATNSRFMVGAPYQFYFGTVKGESALDSFKRKYSILE